MSYEFSIANHVGGRASQNVLARRSWPQYWNIDATLLYAAFAEWNTCFFVRPPTETAGLGKRTDPRLRESPPAVGASSRNLGPTPVVLYCLTAVLPSEMDEGMTDRLPDRLPGTDFEGDTREQRVYISRAEDKRSMDGS